MHGGSGVHGSSGSDVHGSDMHGGSGSDAHGGSGVHGASGVQANLHFEHKIEAAKRARAHNHLLRKTP